MSFTGMLKAIAANARLWLTAYVLNKYLRHSSQNRFICKKKLETVKQTPPHRRHRMPVDNPRKQKNTIT